MHCYYREKLETALLVGTTSLTDLEAVRKAISRGETPDSVARNTTSVPNGDAFPLATWWLNGLCSERQTPKAPSP